MTPTWAAPECSFCRQPRERPGRLILLAVTFFFAVLYYSSADSWMIM
jgi:hypothetical protein